MELVLTLGHGTVPKEYYYLNIPMLRSGYSEEVNI